jgi:DNA polymerase III subunit chi
MNQSPNIDFYVLESASGQKSLHFACQLIEKAYAEQKRIFVHTDTHADAERFDALLWTYRDDSFLPHALVQPNDVNSPPIQIGFGDAPTEPLDTLLNLSKDIPAFYRQFNHIVEIVFPDPIVQQSARQRFKHYRENECNINTIKLKANEI